MHRPKRRESRYHSGRSRDWIKIRNMARPAIRAIDRIHKNLLTTVGYCLMIKFSRRLF